MAAPKQQPANKSTIHCADCKPIISICCNTTRSFGQMIRTESLPREVLRKPFLLDGRLERFVISDLPGTKIRPYTCGCYKWLQTTGSTSMQCKCRSTSWMLTSEA